MHERFGIFERLTSFRFIEPFSNIVVRVTS